MVEHLEKAKNSIRQELDAVLKVAAQQYHDDDKLSDDANQAICNVIEAVFIHGLKDAFFLKGSRFSKYPEPNFWPFVSKFTHRSIKNQINDLKQIKSEIGKARAWIRIVLNEGQLEHYINVLSKDVKQLDNFYIKNAFLRDDERLEALMGYLKALAKLPIKAPTNSSFLNSWTPSPLILSGLINGKPQRVTYLPSASRRNMSSNSLLLEEPAEEAMCALDVLGESTSSETPQSPFRKSYNDDSDDRDSVCSHQSMLESNLPIGIPSNLKPNFAPFLSSTPENRPTEGMRLFAMPPEEESTEVQVHRRKTTRIRRVSKGSNSDESRRGSLSHITSEIIPMSSSLPTASGLMSMAEMEKVLFKETSVPTFGSWNSGNNDFQSPKERKDHDRPLFSTDNSIDETGEVFAPESPLTKSRPITIYSQRNTSIVDDDEREELGMSLHDEILAAGGYGPLSPNTSSIMPDSSPSSGHGCSTGNSLATKGWSVSSRKDSMCSSISSVDNSTNFDSNMRALLTDKNDHDEVVTLRESDFTLDTEKTSGVDEKQGDKSGKEAKEKAEVSLKRTKEMAESEFVTEHEDRGEPVVIDEESLIATDEYGISRNTLTIFTELAIEKGLDKQNYRCLSCRRSIGGPFGKFNLCNLDARYYCDDCFKKGDESIIPARVVLNWDRRKRPISKASKSFLRTNSDRPVIRIDKVNPKLYEHSKQLSKILKLREKLGLVVVYLLSCKQSVAEDLKRRIWPQDYLYTDVHLYSFSDIQNAISGVLERRLNALIKFAISHVESCHLCLQKGFVCEICLAKKIIYPFQMDVADRCQECGTVYHIKCFKNADCPKCKRRKKYAAKQAELPLE